MNLIIDVGNTSIKIAVFENSKLQYLVRTTQLEIAGTIQAVRKEFPKLRKAIISKVGNFPEVELQLLRNIFKVVELTQNTLVPFKNNYSTPATLGVDRIALVSAAAVQFPKKNVLIVDAGSCVTYDFITAENEYLGGGISPGLHMRYKALHTFTANLPLLSPTLPADTIGGNTESAIHSGVFLGLVKEIEGFVAFYREKYPDFTIILTGGDAHLLRDSLKNSIFAIPNFLLEGLDHILEHNT